MPLAKSHSADKLPIKPKTHKIVEQEASKWEKSTSKKRKGAYKRMRLITPVLGEIKKSIKLHTAVKLFIEELIDNQHPDLLSLAHELGRKDKIVSISALKRWIKAYQAKGKEGLLNKCEGKKHKVCGWEAEAISMYAKPSKPAMSDVAMRLRIQGHDDDTDKKAATDSRVRRFINSLPAQLSHQSPMRLGKLHYRLNKTKHIQRDKAVLLVGEIYQGDGHCVDAYVAHPSTGKAYRPELTAYIDIRSRYIPGWYLSESESATSTLFSLSHALLSHDHVPGWVYIDNGSGFKAKMLNDKSIGFYSRFEIATIFQIPGNPRGKGEIEGWFALFRNRHDKFWNNGKDYCGKDQAEEINRKLSKDVEAGKRSLLSLAQYRDSVAKFVDEYNNTPSKALDGKTPAQLWRALDKVPLQIKSEAVIRPHEERKIQKSGIRLHNRSYHSPVLEAYNGKSLQVQYDLHNDEQVQMYDVDGRFVCDANLIMKIPYLPIDRLEQQRKVREQGQIKRLERHIEEVKARSFNPLEVVVPKQIEESRRKLSAEIENVIKTEQTLIESPADRYQRWCLLDKQTKPLSELDQDFYELYPKSSEFLTYLNEDTNE